MEDGENFFNVTLDDSVSLSYDSETEEDVNNNHHSEDDTDAQPESNFDQNVILSQTRMTPSRKYIDNQDKGYDDNKPIHKTDYDLYSHLSTPATPSITSGNDDDDDDGDEMEIDPIQTKPIASKAPKYTMAELFPNKKQKKPKDNEKKKQKKPKDSEKKKRSAKEMRKEKITKKSSSKQKKQSEKEPVKQKKQSEKEPLKQKKQSEKEPLKQKKQSIKKSVKQKKQYVKENNHLTTIKTTTRKRSQSAIAFETLTKKRRIESNNINNINNNTIVKNDGNSYFQPEHFNIIFETLYVLIEEATDISILLTMKCISKKFNLRIILSQQALYYTIRSLEFRAEEKTRSLAKIPITDRYLLKFIKKVKKIIGLRKKELLSSNGKEPYRNGDICFKKEGWTYSKKLNNDVIKFLNDAIRVIIFFAIKWPSCKIQKLTPDMKKYNCLLLRYYDNTTKKETFKSITNFQNHLPNQKMELYTMQWSQNSEFIHSWGNTDKIIYALNFSKTMNERYKIMMKLMLKCSNVDQMKKLYQEKKIKWINDK